MWLAFLLLISNSYAVKPLALQQQYLRKLNRAVAPKEVERVQVTFERIHVLRLACRMQIQDAQVPLSCYESLQLESAWGLYTREQARALEQDLNERCRKAAEGLRLPNPTESLAPLSKFCAAQVEEARGIERYRDRGSDNWSEN